MYDNSQNSPEAIAQKDCPVNIGLYLSEGWQLFCLNPGGFIGFFVLTVIISIALSNIPGAGGILNGIIMVIIGAGYYFVGFKLSKGEFFDFGSFFDGFKNNNFIGLVLTGLISGFITNIFFVASSVSFMIASLPFLMNFVDTINAELEEPDPDLEQFRTILEQLPPVPDGLVPILLLVGIILLLPSIYFGIAYTFAIPLVVDRQFEFWPAMETSRRIITRNWFGFFGLILVIGLINMVGACLCGIGLLVTAPFSACAIVAAYRNIVGLSGATN